MSDASEERDVDLVGGGCALVFFGAVFAGAAVWLLIGSTIGPDGHPADRSTGEAAWVAALSALAGVFIIGGLVRFAMAGAGRSRYLAGFVMLISICMIAVPGGEFVGSMIDAAVSPMQEHTLAKVIGALVGVGVGVVSGVFVVVAKGRQGSPTVVCQRCGRDVGQGGVCGSCRSTRCPKCGRRVAGSCCRACGTAMETPEERS